MFNRIRTIQRIACSQATKSRALSMCLCMAATLATLSACSAQSIEIAELTDEALQIDGTVMYVNCTEQDDTVRVQPHPNQLDLIRVQILDLDEVLIRERSYPHASLEAVIVSLGAGADGYINTTNTRDIVYGGPSGDTIWGGNGVSWLYGEGGEDSLSGGLGNDLVNGGDNIDFMGGGKGNDILSGGAGDNDFLNGGAGEDFLYGDAGIDQLYGGTERDELRGGLGVDSLYGEDGDDLLWGGQSNDTLTDFNAVGGDTKF